jgi:hypothetical protein
MYFRQFATSLNKAPDNQQQLVTYTTCLKVAARTVGRTEYFILRKLIIILILRTLGRKYNSNYQLVKFFFRIKAKQIRRWGLYALVTQL